MPANIATHVFLIRHEGEAQVENARKSYVGDGKLIDPANVSLVYVSPQKRTHRTAEILQLGVHQHQHFIDRETQTMTTTSSGPQDSTQETSIQSTLWLQEWDYGDYEGLTIADIRARRGQGENEQWSIWKDGCPGGESPGQVSERLDLLISEIRDGIAKTAAKWPSGHLVAHATAMPRDIVCIGHGHILAALALRWAGQPVKNGMRLLLEPSSVAVLGFEHDDLKEPAILLGRRTDS